MKNTGFAGKLLSLSLVALAVLAAGCATKKPDKANYVFFPPAPDEPRLQYLWSFGSETELGGRGRFSEFVVGSESIHRPIIKPYGVAIRNGKIYVADTQAANISISDLNTRRMRYIKPSGQWALNVPVNVAVDESGTIFVTDTGLGQVLAYDDKGNQLFSIGQKGEMKPCGLALSQDRIYITDLKGSCVRVYDKTTRAEILAFPDKAEKSDQKRLFQPTNLTIDSSGRIIVSDSGGFSVKIFDSQGKHMQTLGELGVTPGQFALPKGVSTDREGRIYVLDAAAPVVQMFTAKGELLMYFGQPQNSGAGGLYLPASLVVDYDNVKYFEKYAAPGKKLEYVVILTNQLGPKKVSVYGFLKKT